MPHHVAFVEMDERNSLDAANHLELQSTREIGSVNYPYYQVPRVVRPARRLFALISVAGMLLLALVARQLGGHVAALVFFGAQVAAGGVAQLSGEVIQASVHRGEIDILLRHALAAAA